MVRDAHLAGMHGALREDSRRGQGTEAAALPGLRGEGRRRHHRLDRCALGRRRAGGLLGAARSAPGPGAHEPGLSGVPAGRERHGCVHASCLRSLHKGGQLKTAVASVCMKVCAALQD